jgi:hypothetical protein
MADGWRGGGAVRLHIAEGRAGNTGAFITVYYLDPTFRKRGVACHRENLKSHTWKKFFE